MDTGRFQLRLAVFTGLVIAVLLSATVLYTSYVVPHGGDVAEASLKVLVTPVDGRNVTLPPVLGASVDWTDNANGLYDPVSGLLNPVPVGELIGLDPSFLRFPAGRLSQSYNWTYGVGLERRSNPTMGPRPEPSTFGTDEFYRLVNHTGAQGVMVVNANSGDAALARDWVSYCNDVYWKDQGKLRNANGYRLPHNIKYWEIGYEAYELRYWRGQVNSEPGAGALYAKRLKEFSMAMKVVDPSIKIGAWLVLHPDMELTSADDSWNIDFLNEARGTFEVRGVERYYYDYVVVKVCLPGIDLLLTPQDLYRYAYAETYESIRTDLAQLRGLIETHTSTRPGGIPIGIASFEPFYGDDGWNALSPSQAASGVITADLALQALELAAQGSPTGLLYACYGELNTPTFSALMVNPDFEQAKTTIWRRSPGYHVLALCTRLQGGVPLDIAVVAMPTFDVPTEEDLLGVKDVPLVSAFATLHDDGRRVTIVLLNRDLDRPVDCRLLLADWPGRLEDMVERELSFDSLLSDNLDDDSVTVHTREPSRTGPAITVQVPRASVMLIEATYSGVLSG